MRVSEESQTSGAIPRVRRSRLIMSNRRRSLLAGATAADTLELATEAGIVRASEVTRVRARSGVSGDEDEISRATGRAVGFGVSLARAAAGASARKSAMNAAK